MSPVNSNHILIIDDSVAEIELLKKIMCENHPNLKIDSAMDGEKTVEVLNEYTEFSKPEIILLEIEIPIKDGLEVLEYIKQSELLCSIPVIVLSSTQSEDKITRAYELKACCFIHKPDNVDEYSEILKTIEEFWLDIVQLPY